jgi:hypothetical protein
VIARLRALPATGQLAVAVCVAVLVGALLVAVPVLVNTAILLGCVGVVAALGVLVQWLWQHQHATDWSNSFTDTAAARGSDVRVTRLAETVDAAVAGDAVAQTQLHATLRALADERLRRRRGLGLSGDDAAHVRAALGPDLTAYLANPPTGRLTADRVEAYVTTLEEI